MVSTRGTLPVYGYHDLPHLRIGQVNEPHGWFHCFPRFQQVFAPSSNTFLKEQLPPSSHGHFSNQFEENIEEVCCFKEAWDLPRIVQAAYHLIPYFIFSAQEGCRTGL